MMRSKLASGNVGTTSAALPYSWRICPPNSSRECGFMRHISVIARSNSMVVTRPPLLCAATAVYASPVQMSSTRAPARMGPTDASLRAVSSMGSTPTPKRCMEKPAMSAVGARPGDVGIRLTARLVPSLNTWKRSTGAPACRTYTPLASAATTATSAHVARSSSASAAAAAFSSCGGRDRDAAKGAARSAGGAPVERTTVAVSRSAASSSNAAPEPSGARQDPAMRSNTRRLRSAQPAASCAASLTAVAASAAAARAATARTALNSSASLAASLAAAAAAAAAKAASAPSPAAAAAAIVIPASAAAALTVPSVASARASTPSSAAAAVSNPARISPRARDANRVSPAATSRLRCSLAASPCRRCLRPPPPSSVHSISGSLTNASRSPSSTSRPCAPRSADNVDSAASSNAPCVPVGPSAATIMGVRRKGTSSGTGSVSPRSNAML
mmetsp:Transcript_9546/g.23526  ORF Transcript_9546/g.23526 Transcript_9546/m.23526 type:complete len:445 (-) Transcript_9546:1859-3193(-)